MNIYVIVEGEVGEKKVYDKWINYLNPDLSPVNYLDEIDNNNYLIMAGMGFPQYYGMIEAAILDVNDNIKIDRLVIAVDSEENSYEEKLKEIKEKIESQGCRTEIKIIIQHFCFETWGLGNKKAGPRNPKTKKLREYKEYFNVLDKDPELMPAYPEESISRVVFAEKYLRRMLNDKFRNLTYSKSNPEALLSPKYYEEIKKRFETTGHISSFSDFLEAFA